MAARKSRPMTVEQQRQCLQALSQTAAAMLVGLTTRGLQKAQPPAPRNGDGSYCGPQLVQWVLTRSQAAEEDPLLGDGDSPNLERYRAARADLAEMEAAERRAQLVNIDEFVEWFATEVAGPVRRAIEALKQRHGEAAAGMMIAALAKAEAAIEARRPANAAD